MRHEVHNSGSLVIDILFENTIESEEKKKKIMHWWIKMHSSIQLQFYYTKWNDLVRHGIFMVVYFFNNNNNYDKTL